MVSRALGFLYYRARDRYYRWYVHEDTGFRLHRRDLILYSVTFWLFAGSEEVYWIAKRAGADDNSWIITLSNGVLMSSSIMFMYLTHEISKRKKKYAHISD